MNRIDFHSIAAILLDGLIHADYSQMDFIYMLFGSFANNNVDSAFDNGFVCKWIKGQSRISPKIISYYNSEKNRDKFCKDIESELLPYISDVSYTISAIRDLVLCDITTSDEKKDALLTHFEHTPAQFICDVLIYGFSRNFVKARNKDSGSSSPRVDDVMYLPLLPKPTKYFTGRSNALLELHQLLNLHSAVIVNGIPGIGKSELVKAYVQSHQKDYTNILYLDYEKSIYNVICNLDFVDDTDSMSEKDRFRKHFRFLRSLKEDSLIVIDNLDNSRDELLPQICEFKCHILITSRMNLAQYANYELTNSPDDAMEIMHSYYPGISDYYHSEIKELIETVCNHTMSIQLIARLLSLSVYTPDGIFLFFKNKIMNAGSGKICSKLSRFLSESFKRNPCSKNHNSIVGQTSCLQFLCDCYQCKQEEIFICCLICNYRLSLPSHTIVAAIVIETVLYHRWLTVAFAYSVAENVISSLDQRETMVDTDDNRFFRKIVVVHILYLPFCPVGDLFCKYRI